MRFMSSYNEFRCGDSPRVFPLCYPQHQRVSRHCIFLCDFGHLSYLEHTNMKKIKTDATQGDNQKRNNNRQGIRVSDNPKPQTLFHLCASPQFYYLILLLVSKYYFIVLFYLVFFYYFYYFLLSRRVSRVRAMRASKYWVLDIWILDWIWIY